MFWLGIGVAFFLLVIGIVINAIVVISIRRLAVPEKLFEIIEGGPERMIQEPQYLVRDRWAREHDFEPDILMDFHGAIGAGPIQIAVWKNAYRKTYVATYSMAGDHMYEFVTMLTHDSGLTTSNSKDSQLIPSPPGHFIQSYHGLRDLTRLSAKHEAGLIYLNQHRGLKLVEAWASTDVLMMEAARRHAEYVKTIPFWQFRGLYWYLVRRSRLNDKSIEEQGRI